MADPVRTKSNRPWLLKMWLIFGVCLLVGLWFLYDATVVYPRRGWNHASYLLWVYLDMADEEGELRTLEVDAPRTAYERLQERVAEGRPLSDLDVAKLDWLRALDVLGALNTETVAAELTDDPRARLEELRAKWVGPDSRAQPSALSAYDIPVQWLIAVICLGGAAAILIHVLRTIGVRYGWEEDAKRLHLPDGTTIEPGHLEDVDKRKWHKFIVYLNINETHERLAGKAVRLDLYQNAYLESWVLEMENVAFPERAQETAHAEEIANAQGATGDESAPASDESRQGG